MKLIGFIKTHWFTLIYTLVITAIVAFTLVQAHENQYQFVRGQYGNYCYPAEEYPKYLKYLIKFKTLKECLESIKP